MIKRTSLTSHFTVMNNRVFEDRRLSLKAKGLWAFVMTKPDGWQTSIRGLCTQLSEGESAIRAGLKELETIGLYRKTRSQDASGHWSWEDEMLDIPQLDNPVMDNPHVENQRQVKTEEVSTEIVKTEEATAIAVGQDQKIKYGRDDINQMFAEWESVIGYPIKSRVTKNRQACSNLLKSRSAQELSQMLRGVAIAHQDRYAPRVSDFVGLQDKWSDLIVWGKQRTSDKPRVGVV